MSLPDITFNYGAGGLGRALAGNDYISSLMFVNSSLPSGFNSTDRIKKIFSVADAVTLGIDNLYSDETKATSTYTVTNKGTAGDVVTINYTDYKGSVIQLAQYTLLTADISTTTTCALGLSNAINLGTNVHGFVAVPSSAIITITTKVGEGIYPNSGTPYTISITGTCAVTIAQAVVTGVASKRIIEYYHISEYFRLQPQGVLYVAYYATYDATNIALVRDFSNGEIRQFGVFNDLTTAFATSQVTAIQAIATASQTSHKPFSVLYAPEISGTTALSSLTDLTGLSSKNVSVVISQDGAGFGYRLWKTTGKSISDLGAKLGAVAFASVSDSIAWVGKFNMSNGTELDTINFSNGVVYSTVSDSLLTTLNNYGYLFLRKLVGITGSYNTPPTTATLPSSDYHFVHSNRTIDKATRGVRADLLPDLSSPIILNSDGTMTDSTVAYFESKAGLSLSQMVRDSELSNFSVTINPSQNVLSTNTLTVAVKLLPIGVADFIVVNIGFTTNL
jgi:hypothetical protein